MATDEVDRTETADASEVTKMISGPRLKKLLKAQRGRQGDIDTIRGEMGNEVAKAVEKDNLDKKMFGWIKQLDRMSPEKLAYHLPNLLYMLDVSGISERAQQARPLPLEDEAESGAEDAGHKVRPFPKQASVAAE